jgi:hypothetical protein
MACIGLQWDRRPVVRPVVVTAVLLCFVPGTGMQAQTPVPPAELAELEAYVGTWQFEWTRVPSLFGPAGTVTGIERYEWLPGGFFLRMNREASAPEGGLTTIIFFGYDPSARHFTAQFLSPTHGLSGTATITVHGSTRLWSATGRTTDGEQFHERCTRMLAPDRAAMTLTCEASPDGAMWFPVLEGRYTKVRGAN